jgi:hypothetical protein
MGTYRKMAFTQGDRPLYQKTSYSLVSSSLIVVYLFYWPFASEWRISNSHTAGGTASVRSGGIDAALCPNEVTSWLVAQGTSWIGSITYPITVSAPTLPPVRADGNAAPLRAAALRRENGSSRADARNAHARSGAREIRLAPPPHVSLARLHSGSLSALGCARPPRRVPDWLRLPHQFARAHTRALTNSCVHAHIDPRARCADATALC